MPSRAVAGTVTRAAMGATHPHAPPLHPPESAVTQREALRWLSQVDGRLYRSPRPRSERSAWVAVVRTPGSGLRSGKLIVALGETMLEATQAAAEQWREIFSGLSEAH